MLDKILYQEGERMFDFSNDQLEAIYKELPETVRKCISDYVLHEVNDMLLNLEDCESPIEQLMSIALNKQADKILPMFTPDFFVGSQSLVKTSNKEYRVDFLIRVLYSERIYEFVVECDGHEFHEKTKEQVKKDKKRERDLISEGYTVIRFSGSEIVENPRLCAREVINLITNCLTKDR